MAGYEAGASAPEGKGIAMVGNEVLHDRLMKEFHGRLLERGRRERLVRSARREPRRRPAAVRRLGRLLVALGRRLEGANLHAHPC